MKTLQLRRRAKLAYKTLYRSRDRYLDKFVDDYTEWVKVLVVILIASVIYFGLFALSEGLRGNYPVYGKSKVEAICNDGWRSHSYGQGTCSWHGGVRKYIIVEYIKSTHIANPAKYLKYCYIGLSVLIVLSILSKRHRYIALVYLTTITYWLWLFIGLIALNLIKIACFLSAKVKTTYTLYRIGKTIK